MYNVNNTIGGNSNENQKPPRSFNKMNSTQLSKSSNKEVKSTGQHNYWANKNDEFAQGRKKDQQDFMSKMHDKKETRSFGRRKVDYEESVSNNRSYQEEFNVIRNFIFIIFLFF